ncbi:MAG TPA: nucleotidyltransferase family protein [Blastocatellia bacterium]|nr:nucleotidyltransferase family protein [Blastocatellia bacterium]
MTVLSSSITNEHGSARAVFPDGAGRRAELSTEVKLLLAAATPSSRQALSVWESLQPGLRLDWDRFLREIDRHGMWPLFGHWLDSFPCAKAPAGVRDESRRRRQQLALRNLRLTGELRELLESMMTRGVEAIPVKGPTLAMLAFDDVTRRQFCDLDLLVTESELALCAALIVERGYRPISPVESVRDATFRRVTNVLEFIHPEKGYFVELHWRLSADLLPLDLSAARRERRLVETFPGGKRMPTFAPEPLLLYLSIHAAKHCWSKLNWAADIAWLVERRPDLDWDYLFTLARQQRSLRPLKLALALSRDWLGVSLPEAVNRAIDADRAAAELAARVVSWWALPEEQAPSPENRRWERSRFFFEIQGDWVNRGRYLVHLLFAPNRCDWNFVRLPARWTGLYLVLRPLRLLLIFLLPSRFGTTR